eukprot:CAMPEP_0117546686 /NCGR_PEP_ID=MMETSP0784-20121206/46733_1 /TAXON_ID=39447 /ORGANISM="" /LENGTH=430 /DNA_ID=CAMNT_0005343561 /DNA_START=10 /DNA_END=1299 /DNA_ORIENTATION=-
MASPRSESPARACRHAMARRSGAVAARIGLAAALVINLVSVLPTSFYAGPPSSKRSGTALRHAADPTDQTGCRAAARAWRPSALVAEALPVQGQRRGVGRGVVASSVGMALAGLAARFSCCRRVAARTTSRSTAVSAGFCAEPCLAALSRPQPRAQASSEGFGSAAAISAAAATADDAPRLVFAGGSAVDAPSLRPRGAVAEPPRSVSMRAILPKRMRLWNYIKPAAERYRHSPAPESKQEGVNPEKLLFGRYGLQSMEEAWLSSRQIEIIRREIVTAMERRGKLWMRVFPHQVITRRNAESRVGVGMGRFEYWVAAIRPKFVLFEVDGVPEEVVYEAFRRATYKMPIKVRMLKKVDRPSDFDLASARARFAKNSGKRQDGERGTERSSPSGTAAFGGLCDATEILMVRKENQNPSGLDTCPLLRCTWEV